MFVANNILARGSKVKKPTKVLPKENQKTSVKPSPIKKGYMQKANAANMKRIKKNP